MYNLHNCTGVQKPFERKVYKVKYTWKVSLGKIFLNN